MGVLQDDAVRRSGTQYYSYGRFYDYEAVGYLPLGHLDCTIALDASIQPVLFRVLLLAFVGDDSCGLRRRYNGYKVVIYLPNARMNFVHDVRNLCTVCFAMR